MLEKSRKLLAFRKRIIKLLTEQFGYVYEDKRKEWEPGYDLDAWMHGPRILDFLLLSQMDDINTGEAHYRTDWPCSELAMLTYQQSNPLSTVKAKRPFHPDAIVQFFELLFGGWQLRLTPDSLGFDPKVGGKEQFITVNYVDWLHPLRNRFVVSEGWRGVCNDGVAWDLILSVNYIPVVGVMLAPTTLGHRPCEEAYELMHKQIQADKTFDTSCMLCIISDGHTTLVGSPDDPPEWFLPWDVPQEVAREAEAKGGSVSATPFYALLQPEVLLRYLFGYVRPIGEGECLRRYCAHSHQFYAVDAAMRHLLTGEGSGYAVLPKSDEQVRLYPFESNYDTTRQLMVDNMQMGLYGEIDLQREAKPVVRFVVMPQLGAVPDGVCIYRPLSPLVSPLSSDL